MIELSKGQHPNHGKHPYKNFKVLGLTENMMIKEADVESVKYQSSMTSNHRYNIAIDCECLSWNRGY